MSAVWIPELEICRTGRGNSKKGVTYSSNSNHALVSIGMWMAFANFELRRVSINKEKRKE